MEDLISKSELCQKLDELIQRAAKRAMEAPVNSRSRFKYTAIMDERVAIKELVKNWQSHGGDDAEHNDGESLNSIRVKRLQEEGLL